MLTPEFCNKIGMLSMLSWQFSLYSQLLVACPKLSLHMHVNSHMRMFWTRNQKLTAAEVQELWKACAFQVLPKV